MKKKEQINNLTFLVIVHSKLDCVSFYIDLFKAAPRKFPVIFVFDRKNIPAEISKLIIDNKYRYFVNGINKGKLHTVIDVSKEITTDYFKIIDQDDSLFTKAFYDLENQINSIKKGHLVKHNALKLSLTNENKDYFNQSTNEEIIFKQKNESIDLHIRQQTNCDTIFPTNLIKKLSKYNIGRQNFHNDVFLANYCIALNPNLILIYSEFYIHFYAAGQTSEFNIKRAESTLELYENYRKVYERNSKFNIRNIMAGDKNSHIRFIKRFTSEYMKNYDEKYGNELKEKTLEILEELWKN